MENLEQQTRIINLGNIIVQQLSIDNSTDTLSRWMAHYIAEKITLAESLSAGEDKDNAEKECFETILKLWEHRWLLPPGKRPLEDFESILNVLDKIRPEKDDPFFYRFFYQDLSEKDNDNLDPKEMSESINTILQIDKVARIWIEYILIQTALKANNEHTESLLKNTINLPGSDDIKAIKFIFDNESALNSKSFSEDNILKNQKINKLKKRIDELEIYSAMNKLIVDSYKNELLSIEST